MTIRINVAMRDMLVSAGINAVGYPSGGEVKIYTGAQPATADTAVSGTLLVTIPFANGHNAASGGSATLVANESALAAATGTAGWACWSVAGGPRIDMSVGTTGTDAIINSTSIVSGVAVTLTSLTLSQPAS